MAGMRASLFQTHSTEGSEVNYSRIQMLLAGAGGGEGHIAFSRDNSIYARRYASAVFATVRVRLSVCPSQAGIVYNVSLTHEVDGCVRPLNDVKSSLF